MIKNRSNLILSTSPFLKDVDDTNTIMWRVVYSLIPVVIGAVYFFGISAILVIMASLAGALLSEYFINVVINKSANTLKDGSAMITGLLLALTLPPGIPLWMAFLGGSISIVGGKMIFGGLGYNPFNPALLGRAFLQGNFPAAMTTWSPVAKTGEFFSLRGDTFALPFLTPVVDGNTAATPLALMKWEKTDSSAYDMLIGNIAGCLGETSVVLIAIGGLYLMARGIVNWRVSIGMLAGVYITALALYLLQPGKYNVAPPHFYLLSGGVMLGAFYMATDMVTCPITQRGMLIFGVSTGVLVMVIRVFGGLPEGVMYAILLMNSMVPMINQYTRRKIFGEVQVKKSKA